MRRALFALLLFAAVLSGCSSPSVSEGNGKSAPASQSSADASSSVAAPPAQGAVNEAQLRWKSEAPVALRQALTLATDLPVMEFLMPALTGQDAVVLVGKPELSVPQAAFYVTETEALPLDIGPCGPRSIQRLSVEEGETWVMITEQQLGVSPPASYFFHLDKDGALTGFSLRDPESGQPLAVSAQAEEGRTRFSLVVSRLDGGCTRIEPADGMDNSYLWVTEAGSFLPTGRSVHHYPLVLENGSFYELGAVPLEEERFLQLFPEGSDWLARMLEHETRLVREDTLDSEYTFLYRGDGTVDVNLRYGDFDWGWQCCHLTLTPGQPLPEPGTPEGIFQPGRRMEAGCPAIARQPRLPDALAEPGGGQ